MSATPINERLLERIQSHYPSTVAEAYRQTVEADGDKELHDALFRLGETLTRHLAILAWHEYERRGEPDGYIEGLLHRKHDRPAFGDWVDLLAKALPLARPSILDIPLGKQGADELQRAAEFVAVWELVKKAAGFKVPGDTLAAYIASNRQKQSPKVDVISFLKAIVQCRNAAQHHKYKVDKDLCAVLNPPLHDGLCELLVHSSVSSALCDDFCWAIAAQGSQCLGAERFQLAARTATPTLKKLTIETSRGYEAGSYIVDLRRGDVYLKVTHPFDSTEMPTPQAGFAPVAAPSPVPPAETSAASEFRELVEDAGEDGRISEDEARMIEKRRVRLGLGEVEARAIVQSVVGTQPPASEPPPAKPAVAPVAPPSTRRSKLGQIVELVDEQKTPTWGRGINFVLLGALRSQNGRCTRQYLLDSLTRSVALKEVQTRCDLPMLTYGFCTMGIRDGWLRVAAAQPAPAVEPVPPAPTVPGLEWPESGRAFLARVKRRAHGQLAFVPVAVASDAEIAAVESDKGDLWFMATPVHSLSVWFSSKRGEHVYVVVGFYSNNKSRDPEYRHVREAIESAMGGRPLPGGWSLMRPKWRDLALEGSRRVVMEELDSEALLDETVSALVHLSRLVADHLDGVQKAVGVEADTPGAQPAEGTAEEDEHDEGNQAPGLPGQTVYHLNVGGYSLTDDLRHGHWEAGGGARYRAAVVRLKPGDTVYLYRSGVGYVAAGLVTGEQAVRLETYVEERGLEVDATTAAFVASSRGQPDETAEWVREIAWRSVRPTDQGFRVRDHLPAWSVPIMTACRIMNPEVVALLAREFGDVEAARPGEPG